MVNIMIHCISSLTFLYPCCPPSLPSDSKSTAADSGDIRHVAGGHQLLGDIEDLSFPFGLIGCSIIQKCLVHAEGEAEQLLDEGIILNATVLAEDPYGLVCQIFKKILLL